MSRFTGFFVSTAVFIIFNRITFLYPWDNFALPIVLLCSQFVLANMAFDYLVFGSYSPASNE